MIMNFIRFRKHLIACIAMTVLAVALGILPVWANSLYTDISLSYYNRFFSGMNTENFQRYHVLKGGYQTDTFDINLNFNMFEDVNGPLADHNINPFTLETAWQVTDHDEVQANCMYLTNVHCKEKPFVEVTVESRYKRSWVQGNWQFSLVPILSLNKQDEWSLLASLGAGVSYQTPKARWSLELNGLDPKDYAVFSRGTNVLTAQVRWPTWGNTEMSIGLNALLGSPSESPLPHGLDKHQEAVWMNISVFFGHPAEICL